MKKYKFDYMKDWVLKWDPEEIKKITTQQILMLPYDIFPPWIMPGEYIPAKDHYGEEIEDMEEWLQQREQYAKELVEEIKKNKIKAIKKRS